MGKRWYTDGEMQLLSEECPEGFRPGRLPVSEETRKKHSENNGWKSMTEEQKAARAKKISDTKRGKSEDDKKAYSAKLSAARKGKGKGKAPWNKGKKGLQEAWNKGRKATDEEKAKAKAAYEALPQETKDKVRLAVSMAHKGKEPWNKGKICPSDPETVRLAKMKETESKKLNGSYGKSALEEEMYSMLVGYFGQEAVKRQYYDAERYPFACDFYVEPLDLFIEVNGNWTHGYRPYDPADPWCIEQFGKWRKKAEDSDYYKNALYTWTDLDVRKAECAERNDLNYIALYRKEEWLKLGEALREAAAEIAEQE